MYIYYYCHEKFDCGHAFSVLASEILISVCAVIFVFLYLKDLFKKFVVQILINRLHKKK